MLELLNISTASLNQTPLHWNHNKENIINSIFNAYQQNSHLLLLPELTITGYGCEDLFFSPEVSEKAFTVLKDIVSETSMVPNRPARTLYERNVDVVLNPSASHFAIGKQATREQFVKEGSRAFGLKTVPLIY